jgi:hypothetical protein
VRARKKWGHSKSVRASRDSDRWDQLPDSISERAKLAKQIRSSRIEVREPSIQ